MGVKRGRIVADTTPPTKHAYIRRLRLDTGATVHVPSDIYEALTTRQPPATEFYFIEKGLLGRVEWAGTLEQLQNAIGRGVVSRRDIGNLILGASAGTAASAAGDIDLAMADPGAAFDTRLRWTLSRTAADLSLLPGLPNPTARNYSLVAAALPLAPWEYVASVKAPDGRSAAQSQYDIWQATTSPSQLETLSAVWMAAQVAFELVLVGTISRNQAECASLGDRPGLNRWHAILEWVSTGGAGVVNQAAGHLATRPYSSRRTLEQAMYPVSEVLPFAVYGDLGARGVSD